MKVHFTEPALADLDEIIDYTARHFPSSSDRLEERIRTTIEMIAEWPAIAPRVDEEAEVRVATLIRFPFRIFYRAAEDYIEILHIRHAARKMWDDE